MKTIVRFAREENGEDLIEYGLLAAFVATVATAVIIADPLGIKGALKGAFQKAKDALDNSSRTPPGGGCARRATVSGVLCRDPRAVRADDLAIECALRFRVRCCVAKSTCTSPKRFDVPAAHSKLSSSDQAK